MELDINLFVAVDILSCYLWVEHLKLKMPRGCKKPIKKLIVKQKATNQFQRYAVQRTNKERFGKTRGASLLETLRLFIGQRVSIFIPPKTKQILHWLKEIVDLSSQ